MSGGDEKRAAMRETFLFILLICTVCIAQAEEFSGKIIAVLDGDTVLVARGKERPVKVRLADIDAPEKAQEYGMASRQSLQDMVLRKQVQINSKAVDDYGRLVADIIVGGLNVNHEQVRRGMAWNYSRFRSSNKLAALQREAQLAKRGLWADALAIEPSQWRKQHPSAKPLPNAAASPSLATSDSACVKKRCAQMTSCEEAKYYLAHCHITTLDGDRDGMPCESLCAPKQ